MKKRSIFAVVVILTLVMASISSAQDPSPSDLPLLPPGQHISALYGEGSPEASETLGTLYFNTLQEGASGYELSYLWSNLEPEPGVFDLSAVREQFEIMRALELQPYLLIQTIDTVVLALPRDLVNESGSDFVGEYAFDHPEVQARFHALLDELIPLLLEYNGFALSVANEIDPFLNSNRKHIEPFLNFLQDSRDYIHSIEPQMAVGATLTISGLLSGVDYAEDVLARSDVAIYTYYPLASDFTVKDPDLVFEEMAYVVELAGDLPIIMQELGYPSGYLDAPTNESSQEKQAQFVAYMFDVFEQYPQIRTGSFLHLGEWSDATCDSLLEYYMLDYPQFREYLCTLGMITYDGDPKQAYEALLEGLRGLND